MQYQGSEMEKAPLLNNEGMGQEETAKAEETGFQTGEELVASSTARLAKLKALYRQKLGFDGFRPSTGSVSFA